MTPEENANLCLQKQGFIVIGAVHARPKKPGDIVQTLDRGPDALNHPVVVVAESNAEEWQQQRMTLGLEPEAIPEGAVFYRVVAE